MSGSPERAGRERFVGWYQPAGVVDDVAGIFVLNETGDLMVANGVVEASAAEVTSVAPWDAVLTSLGFARTSSWSRYHWAMRCTAEPVTHPG